MKTARRPIGGLAREREGAVAVIIGVTFTIIMAMSALAMDAGRVIVLKNQMQNAADAAVLSGATQLNGQDNAIARATTVATSTVSNSSGFIGGAQLTVASVLVLSSLSPDTAALNEAEARFIRVTLTPQTLTLFMQPLVELIGSTSLAATFDVQATAAATISPIVCNAAPFMACDPAEGMTPADSLLDWDNAGRQILLKTSGGGAMAPGNFGMLCPADGNCGAASVSDALAEITVTGCYGQTVTTSPGVAMNQVRNGINGRFDQGNQNPHDPARNVIHYLRDSALVPDNTSNYMGDGDWDRATYWADKHNGAGLPGDLIDASRYQAYLYELGETYAANGRKTLYPLPASLPPGFAILNGVTDVPVAPPPNDTDPAFDGVPESIPEDDPKRRVVKAAVLNCVAQNVQGSGSYTTYGRFVELFITEMATAPPSGRIYGELIGPLTEEFSTDFHANVQLVE